MSRINIAQEFLRLALVSETENELFRLMEDITVEIGFRHFALINHADLKEKSRNFIQLYNYPMAWVENFVENGLYAHDPVLQASMTSAVGFVWTEVPTMIKMTNKQHVILESAARCGLGDGFTVPANIPGEIGGSCSFATRRGALVPSANLLLAQLIGAFAFQAARRLNRPGSLPHQRSMHLTPRQRDCLLWAIKGKTDWEIGKILGLKEETVTEYLDNARERYGVVKRLPLAVHAIYDGEISFIEALF